MMKKQIQVTIVPRQLGQLFDELMDGILNCITEPSNINKGKQLTDMIPYHYYSNYNVHQAKCYQQYSSNLCGYHAIYNTLCCLHLFIQNGTNSLYSMQNGAAFWRFKARVSSFLHEIKQINHIQEEWPWRQKDINEGDFQRTHNKVCMMYFDEFEIFKNNKKFEFISHTWQFQYGRLMLDYERTKILEKDFAKFNRYTGIKPIVMSLMLAITNHWKCFVAFKSAGRTEYWLFDSLNRFYLDYNEEQILQMVQEAQKQRQKLNKKPLKQFQRQAYAMRMRDTQNSMKLIIECLEGRTTLETYNYNKLFQIFAQHLQTSLQNQLTSISAVISDYWWNIRNFFQNPLQWKLLNQQNQSIMIKLLNKADEIRSISEQGSNLYHLIKKHRNLTKA